jgi:hypothetical protein
MSENKNRRSFLKGSLTAAAAVAGGSALGAPNLLGANRIRLGKGGAAIPKFLATAELIEAHLWRQYAELGGLMPANSRWRRPRSRPMNGYEAAFRNFDADGPQYISSNNLDEQSHAHFLNAYLAPTERDTRESRPVPDAAEQQGYRGTADRPYRPEGHDGSGALSHAKGTKPGIKRAGPST